MSIEICLLMCFILFYFFEQQFIIFFFNFSTFFNVIIVIIYINKIGRIRVTMISPSCVPKKMMQLLKSSLSL